jgi:hypothetical protein
MVTVVGKVSREELERLHPEEQFKRAPSDRELAKPMPAIDKAKTGVMVLIDAGHGKSFFATDFASWFEPLAPTLREAQAFRATREVCKLYLSDYKSGPTRLTDIVTSDEAREELVQDHIKNGFVSMHVIDVPAEAFE